MISDCSDQTYSMALSGQLTMVESLFEIVLLEGLAQA